jgi:putative Mg2+ transporter-C (MgtC) family protein
MDMFQQAEVILQLLLASFLSMIIGMDREARNQPAGLRTHMLVALGACLFTALSKYAFPGDDNSRIASNIVVGIGFLGAGTIINRNNQPQHLTTAASIWSTAAVGMAVGAGAWFLALGASLIIWTILSVIRRWSKDEPPAQSVIQESEAQ